MWFIREKIQLGKFLYSLVLLLPFVLLSSCTEDAPKIEGMTFVPAGEFTMGSNKVDDEGLGKEFGARTGNLFDAEHPERKVSIGGYYIDTYEVTNSQYKGFADATGYPTLPFNWEGRSFPKGKEKHPVNNVTWYDAHNYCAWAGKRLLAEAEWEKAARGPNGNQYPWGNEYSDKAANLETGDTVEVGSYETDKSYYGVYDMGGNVMEWTGDWFKRYPGNTADIKDYGQTSRSVRGGAGTVLGHYIMEQLFARSSFRQFYIPEGAGPDGGIRCAKSPAIK